MRLAETFQCNLQSDEVPHTEQWGDRQPCELRVDAEQAREVLLNVSGDSRFGLRIHRKGGRPEREKDNANVISAYGQFVKNVRGGRDQAVFVSSPAPLSDVMARPAQLRDGTLRTSRPTTALGEALRPEWDRKRESSLDATYARSTA